MWDEIKKFVSDLFADLKEFVYDCFAAIFDAILGGIATLIEAMPVPEFMTNYSLGDYIHADVAYFLAASGFDQALTVVGAAYVFRIVRRIVTLGIW